MTLKISYNRKRKAWHVRGTDMYFGPAPGDDYEEFCDWLGRKLCDNPAAQSMLGVLGADSVEFERA